MNTVYAKVNISKKLGAILKSGTPFLVETDDIDSGEGHISFEVKDGIDPLILAALGPSSISISPIAQSAPDPENKPAEKSHYPSNAIVGSEPPVEKQISSETKNLTQEDYVVAEDLIGGSKPVSNFSVKQIVQKKQVPQKQTSEKQILSPAEKHAKKPVQKQSSVKTSKSRKHNSIENPQEFYKFLDSVEYNPNALEKDEKRMSRSEAVNAEKSGGIGSGISMYIINKTGCQLVIDDLNIRLLKDSGYNLGSIPAEKLKASTHLFEALNSGAIEFVSRKAADKARLRATKRMEQITKGEDSNDIYDNTDDVYDEIEEGGIDEAAVNAVPDHLKNAISEEVNVDDDYETELDAIQGAMEFRESEIEQNPLPVEKVPGKRVVERET